MVTGPTVPIRLNSSEAGARIEYTDNGRPVSCAAGRWELTRLAQTAPLAVAGEGATWHFAEAVGAELLAGDPVTAAPHVALHRGGSVVEEPA